MSDQDANLVITAQESANLDVNSSEEPNLDVDAVVRGPAGHDATINGVNTLTLDAKDGLALVQEGNTATISGSILQSQVANKQDTISDLDNIRSNAAAGKSASDTIGTYGNIVTHNVNEFATAAQGTKADTALQQIDLSAHNESSLSHADIRQTAGDALVIAKGKARSMVFNTFALLESWLKDSTHTEELAVGDNLYIKDTSVPDYWVSAVLQSADPVTGYYYEISPLESEVPDISNMMTTDTAQTATGDKNFTGALQKNGVNVATATDINALQTNKQDTISDLNEIRAGASAGSSAVQPAALDAYATKQDATFTIYRGE